jgi:tetratricopeptide (TPR) repeat protein
VNKTKGMVEASVYGALNMVQNNGWLKIMFCPVQQINDAIEIKVGEKIIFSKQVSLAPTINFIDSVKYNPTQGDYAVSIGGVKLNYSSASSSNVLSRPVESPSNFDWNNANGFYIKGKEFMDQKLYDQAEAALATSLKMDSNYLPALVKMSSLQYRNHNYNSALVLVKKALSIDTHDGSANYYYGIINAALGNTVDAKDGFDLATLSAEYKTGAYTELAKLYLAEKNYSNVIDYTNKALTYNAINIAALQLSAIKGAFFSPKPFGYMRSHGEGLLIKTLKNSNAIDEMLDLINERGRSTAPLLFNESFVKKTIARIRFASIREMLNSGNLEIPTTWSYKCINLLQRLNGKVSKKLLIFIAYLLLRPFDILYVIYYRAKAFIKANWL